MFARKEERIQLSLKKREDNIDCHEDDGDDGGEGLGGSGDGDTATINQTFIFKHFLNIKKNHMILFTFFILYVFLFPNFNFSHYNALVLIF